MTNCSQQLWMKEIGYNLLLLLVCVSWTNWSATKQRLHPQSVAEINRHSVLSGDSIRQCETSSGSRHKDTDRVCKLPFRSAGTAVFLYRLQLTEVTYWQPNATLTLRSRCTMPRWWQYLTAWMICQNLFRASGSASLRWRAMKSAQQEQQQVLPYYSTLV